MLSFRSGLLFSIMIILCVTAASAICPQYLSSTLWSWVDTLDADDQYLYLSLANGLVILDHTDPQSPVEVGRVELPGKEGDIKLANGLAYVSVARAGLYIVDIADPTTPAILGFYPCESISWGFDVDQQYAYLPSQYAYHIELVDITDPSNPFLAADHTLGHGVFKIWVRDDFTFIIGGESGFRVYYFDGPLPPVPVAHINTLWAVHDMYIQGDTAYLLDFSGGSKSTRDESRFVTIDISNPVEPQPLCYSSAFGHPSTLTISGDYAYLCDSSDDRGVIVVDVSDPAQPVEITNVPEVARPRQIVANGDRVFAAQSYRGVAALDVSNPISPDLLWSWREAGLPVDVWAEGDYAYVADQLDGIWVVDISDLTAPEIVKEIYIPGVANSITGEDDYLYVSARDGGLHIFDTTDPADPVLVHTINQTVHELFKVGHLGYAACDASGMRIYDLSDPTLPVTISHLTLPGDAEGIVVSGNLATVAAVTGGLHFIDITNPVVPQHVSSYDPGSLFYHVVMMDHYAIAPNSSYGLHVVDLSDPGFPVLASQTELQGIPHGIELVGDQVLVSHRFHRGVVVFDLSNPEVPEQICHCITDGSAMHTFVLDELVLVADFSSLTILIDQVAAVDDPPPPAATNNLRLRYNNPIFGDTRLQLASLATGDCRVEILDVSGRLLRTLYNDHISQSTLDLNWRLGTEPSGTYYLRVVTDRHQVTKSVILIR